MSLSNQIIQQLQNTIEMYINNISDKYNINKNELTELWSGNKQPVSKPIIEINMDDLSIGRLMKCTNKELSALCKSHGKKSTGKKDELIARLTEKEDPTKQVNTPTTKKVETESKLNTSKTKKLETIQSTCHCNSLLIAKIVFQVMNYQFKKMKLKTENINKIFGYCLIL